MTFLRTWIVMAGLTLALVNRAVDEGMIRSVRRRWTEPGITGRCRHVRAPLGK